MEREEKERLLDFAYDVLRSLFSKKKVDIPSSDLYSGEFVTLRKDGRLRGCIGYMEGIAPIYEMTSMLIREAAFHDYRFPPLREDELPEISIELSLLSPMRNISSLDDFHLGRDGLLMSLNGRRAVFLPEVASETGWDERTFFEQLSLKAGLKKDAYMDGNARFRTFQAEVIG